ncbi:hypothetical protein CXB51_018766 [Gossypium anomalum]|uniref:Reverse transcriptase Ty1/copia-type domain-containing protein n=1 Tax=Gossypium anomalum TaxID=47600 RepID=A0A8J5ZGZ8_9ROSI|nr:hypothetical protein CXB51_018766 [Gossypium anomalum]
MATLTDVSPYTGTGQVSIGNGESVSIDNVGSSNILAGFRLLRLRDVLHVPTYIQTRKTLLVGHMHDGLYRFDFSQAGSCETKTEVPRYFSQFYKMIQVQFGQSIKMLQTDGEQNGVVERRHRHIVDMGLTLLAKASMPLKYWSDAFSHVVHLINRLPAPVLQNFSPYEKLYKKGYRCLAADGRVYISRHVLFDELEFPFQTGFSCSQYGGPVQFSHQYSHVPASSDSSLSCSRTVVPGPSPVSSSFPSVLRSLSTISFPGAVSAEVTVPASPVQSPSSDVPHAVNMRSSSPANCHPMHTRPKSGAEYEALISNHTWDLVPLPAGCLAVGCKWIFEINRNADGSIAKYKGRLVVKGYLQEAGVNFYETFSLVVKPTTVRVMLALAVSRGWSLRQHNGDGQPLVCRLRKALYGLKQAPRAWFHKLREFLLNTWFVASKADSSLFIRQTGTQFLYVLVYVDDIIVTGTDSGEIEDFVKDLHDIFSLKDLGQLSYFLGIEVTCTSHSVFLSQKKYILDLLQHASMANSKPSPTPMVTSCKLSVHEGTPVEDEHLFRNVVGALQYVVIIRPDIAFSVNKACLFMHRPLDTHYKVVKRILRYLRGTLDFGLCFTRTSKLFLEGYFNASWASDTDNRRSTFGFCVFLGGNPISWSSRKQYVVSCSTTEVEYRSLAQCDSSAAVAVANNPVMDSKFKHVELDLFFIKERVANGSFQVGHISSQDQVADILTKPLSVGLFDRFRHILRVLSKEEGSLLGGRS